MLVIPTQSNVTLVYGKTIENIVGNTLTVTGWVIVAVVLRQNKEDLLKSLTLSHRIKPAYRKCGILGL
jgi:hypothetical protein